MTPKCWSLFMSFSKGYVAQNKNTSKTSCAGTTGKRIMSINQKVTIILEEINEYAFIPTYMEKYYIKSITKAMSRIDLAEKEEAKSQT